MRTYRLHYTGEPAWLIVIAVLTLPLASFPAFLYWLYFLRVEVTETEAAHTVATSAVPPAAPPAA